MGQSWAHWHSLRVFCLHKHQVSSHAGIMGSPPRHVPFGRFMGVLKKYVRNRARPDGSISMGHQTEEVIEFCVDFIPDLKPIGLPELRHEGRMGGKGTLGSRPIICRDAESWKKAHSIVLHNSALVSPYIDQHENILRLKNPEQSEVWIKKEHDRTFSGW